MKNPVRDLPDFASPPLSEVVLSVQFGSLIGLSGLHLGVFWKQFRTQYPDVSERPPIQTVFETFGTSQTAQPKFQLEAFLSPPMPRYFFEKSGKPDLLQIQHDRIVHNWRKGDGEVKYPRFDKVKAKFTKELLAFSKWISEEGLGEIRPNQCEVTYTNLIDDASSATLHADLSKLTPLLTDQITEEMSAYLEDITTNLRFIFSRDDEPVGRVYVQFQPVFRQADLAPMFKLEITARGRPAGTSLDNALSFLDDAHEHVVKTFAAVTSAEMHKVWGRKDVHR